VLDNITDLRFRNWQIFGRPRFESDQSLQRKRDFSSRIAERLSR